MTDVRSVDQRLAESKGTDHSALHDTFLKGMRKLADELYRAFDVERHPSSDKYESFSSPDGRMRGSVNAYTGEKLDWVIDSWIGSPEAGFTNHHLTIYLPPTSPVPHLGFAIGTIPDLFCFCDLVPRTDLWMNTEELDTYHAKFNDRFMRIAEDDRYKPFISREPYIRVAASPVALCLTAEPTVQNAKLLLDEFQATLRTWIGWVKEAPTVPVEQQEALGARDALMRRTICERDPANVVAEKVLGAEMTEELVRLLWAAEKE